MNRWKPSRAFLVRNMAAIVLFLVLWLVYHSRTWLIAAVSYTVGAVFYWLLQGMRNKPIG